MRPTAVQETPVCLNSCSSSPSKWPLECTTSPARDLCIGIWLPGTSWSQRMTFARYRSTLNLCQGNIIIKKIAHTYTEVEPDCLLGMLYCTDDIKRDACSCTQAGIHFTYALLLTGCWLWHVSWLGWWDLLRCSWWDDSSEVDSSWSNQLPQVLHCQWCLELWLPAVWDLESGTQTLWRC